MNQHSPVDALVANVSAILLALLGVDYYAMLWAFTGALVALTQTNIGRGRALVYVLLSTLVGSVLGSAAIAFLGSQNRVFLALLSLVAGVGWQTFIALLLRAVEGRLKQLTGGTDK